MKYATSCGIFMQANKSEEKDLSHQEAIQMRRLTASLQASLKKMSTEGTAGRLSIMTEISKTR